MLQRLAVPVRPGKTDGAPRPGGKAWLGVCWSLTEVVWLISTVSTSARQGRPQESPCGRERHCLLLTGAGCTPSAGRVGCGRVFLEALAEGDLTEDLTFLA